MKFSPGTLPGVWIVDLDPRGDGRGCLTKVFDAELFATQGLNTSWAQHLTTTTKEAGTIRGMHWQADPHPETKLIRCTRGRAFDVLVDIRPDSDTFGQWDAHELSPDRPQALYAPAGFAHALQTLEPLTEMSYLISTPFRGELQRGFRWDDPTVGIAWPLADPVLSERDLQLPNLGHP